MAELIGMNIAVIVVTISIILSGILIGLGRAFSYRNVERFGVEELLQSILNAAIVGAAALIVESVKTISSSVVTPACGAGDAITELGCVLNTLSVSTAELMNQCLAAMNLIGYYQTLTLNFGTFSIQPLVNLSGASSILSSQVLALNLLLILVNLNAQIVSFFAQNALALFFPIGLILRSFFPTRKMGGVLIGVALGMYIFYPAFVLAFPAPDLTAATANVTAFNSNPLYAAMPVLNLNDNYAIAGKLDNMSAGANVTLNNVSYVADFSGDLTVLAQMNATAISQVLLYGVFAPIFSLLVTLVFIREMGEVLGGELQFKTEVI
jgi:hypothetical protein